MSAPINLPLKAQITKSAFPIQVPPSCAYCAYCNAYVTNWPIAAQTWNMAFTNQNILLKEGVYSFCLLQTAPLNTCFMSVLIYPILWMTKARPVSFHCIVPSYIVLCFIQFFEFNIKVIIQILPQTIKHQYVTSGKKN